MQVVDTTGNPRVTTVTTGSRLHFGPLSWMPRTGRNFGGWGVMIETPRTVVRVGRSSEFREAEESRCQSQRRAEEMLERLKVVAPAIAPSDYRVIVDEEPPAHSGFGSGTQLTLAIAQAAHWQSQGRWGGKELARLMGRGKRSAVGIHGFFAGGLIAEAGMESCEGEIGVVKFNASLPFYWRFVVIRSPTATGLFGAKEAAAFDNLPPFSDQLSNRLRKLLFDDIKRALSHKEWRDFALAMDEYGTLVGEAFSPLQGGVVHSESLPIWMALRERGVIGMAQTSWGPTLAIICENAQDAVQMVGLARGVAPDAEISIARPWNRGAMISPL
jgi:beta-ribofuranosylaminobenzene 5'-phosphate synthase